MSDDVCVKESGEALRLDHIAKSFSKNKVLININFAAKLGEVRALVGENGAGKSTMIRIVAGASQPDSGEMYLNGQKVHLHSPKDGLDAGIAVIYQELDLLPELTVVQNMFLGIETRDRFGLLDHKAMGDKAQAYFDDMHLDINRNAILGILTIAAQQVVAIAKAAMHSASILIMDEPSSSLTNKELKVLFEQIRRLKAKNVCVIYISHRMEEIFEICDSVTVLRDGRLIQTANVCDVSREQIIEWMIGKKVSETRMNTRSNYDGEIILDVRNLCYGETLKKVNFQVKKGELYGVLGLLGSGFIEIGKLLYGVYQPTGGSILIGQKNISRMKSPADALKNSIAYVPDQRRAHGLFMELDVLTNATITSVHNFLSPKLKLLEKKKMNHHFSQYVKKFEIKIANEHQLVRFLSGGNQQKIIIARTLISDTEIIVMSCPTKGIDVGSKYDIYGILLDCVAHGKTVVVISQEIPELVQICDRILMLKKGEVYREYRGDDINEALIYSDLLMQ
ncbi:MAG: sugar ABC transporter ATP-binding protein [Clostridia bacterium]